MMQPQTLPISVNSAGPSPAAAASRGQSGNGAPENTQFGQTLSREIEQRQQARSQAPAPAPQQQAKPAQAQAQAGRNESKAPAKAAEGAAKQERADAGEAAEAQAASGSTPAGAAEADEAAASAVESTAVTPVTDMLALVASMSAPPVAAPVEADPAAAVTAGPAAATVSPAAAGAALAATALAPVAPLASADVLATAVAATPAVGLAVAQDAATLGSAAPPETAPDAGMFADALAQAAQGNRAQQAAQQGAPAGAAPQQDAAALAALTERVADSAASATPPAQEASFVSQVQAARLEQVQANPLAAGDRLPARVGTPAWDRQLGQKIVWMVAGADQSATLTLNPPDLGPVQVVLNVTNDQATVNFTSAQLEVRQALETAMPKLREMMGESGITLGSATVNAGMPEQQQQAQRGNDARNGNGGGNGRGPHDGAGSEGNGPAAPVRRAALPGQVDTFA